MSNWQGANVQRRAQPKQRTGETVEAALFRLNSAYEASMDCIIQLQRADRQKSRPIKAQQMAQAARRTLEVALLRDPWIAHLVPKSSTVLVTPTNLPTSKGHTATVEKLAYLSLVNYADLLVMCVGSPNNASSHDTILDRGIVKPLQSVLSSDDNAASLWVVRDSSSADNNIEMDNSKEQEPRDTTIKLALCAYLDAVGLDGSDPILWLKLACAARRLPNFWRLQKYSLERAISCLPKHEPPNRTALRAWQEFGDSNVPPVVQLLAEPSLPETIALDIPRYSWSNLGRLLLRTCRETVHPAFVSLRLSPMLVLQPVTLAIVCSFLPEPELWKLEVTCRALSASVLSARALNQTNKRNEQRAVEPPAERAQQQESESRNGPPEPSETIREISEGSEGRVKRSSKRVQSQIESSEKRNERSNRRNSVNYCLLAATLGCTPNDVSYKKSIQDNWHKRKNTGVSTRDSSMSILAFGEEQKDARLKDSSLRSFVERLSKERALSPTACLFRFVSHVSMHIDDVFSSDPSGSAVVSNCLLDCFRFMAREKLSDVLVPCWSLSPELVPNDARLKPDQVFALDLLHAELRLKLCEGKEPLDCGFNSDANFVSTVIPRLLSGLRDISDKCTMEVRDVLLVRCNWLAANFYLWRGSLTSNIAESREAEIEGLRLIEETKRCLNVSTTSFITTPHLVSPERKGQHWRYLSAKTLSAFADEIQASSIVLKAQEQFFQATEKFVGSDGETLLSEDDCNTLYSIGESLLERYSADVDSPDAKYAELVEDVLNSFNPAVPGETIQEWLDGCFPDEAVRTAGPLKRLSSAPSILTILVACLQTKPGQSTAIVRLLVRLGLEVIKFSESTALSKRAAETRSAFSDAGNSIDDDLGSEDERNKSVTDNKLHQYACLIEWFLITTSTMIETDMERDAIRTLVSEDSNISLLLRRSLEYVGQCCQYLPEQPDVEESLTTGDLDLYHAARSLFKKVQVYLDREKTDTLKFFTRMYFWGSVDVILSQRLILTAMSKPKVSGGRADWYRKQRSRADLVASVCCDIGLLLSQHQFKVSAQVLERSFLMFDAATQDFCGDTLTQLCDTLLWFWKVSSSSSASESSSGKNEKELVSLDKFGRERLRVPVATAIVGLSGAAISTDRAFNVGADSQASLLEFYDSDSSSLKRSDAIDEKDGDLLRVLSQAVHCACNVFGRVNEGDSVNYAYLPDYKQNPHGPLLPLVVTRVLNKFAWHLLVDFSEKSPASSAAIWSDYPFGTRTVGLLLDSMLYKAYKCLHGIGLSNALDSKESTSHPTKPVSEQIFPPESTRATADLYRCMMRAYGQGRKSPPKLVLDFVSAALPVVQNDDRGVAIRKFLFSSNVDDDTKLGRIVGLVAKRGDWDGNAQKAIGIDFDFVSETTPGEEQDEATMIRRGLSNLISQGSLPRYQESGDFKELRSSSAQAEEELSKKFMAIVENICFGSLGDCEGWFKASQCLTMKADIVADRLGLSCGFSRTSDFSVQQRRGVTKGAMKLSDLEMQQKQEFALKKAATVYTLGNDLSVFLRHCWSSFESLQACATEVETMYNQGSEEEDDRYCAKVWQQLQTLFAKKEYSAWQQGWGGLFVSSLRIMAYRCLTMALYSSYKSANSLIGSEILETLGVNMYTEIMGSQAYGFPMCEMTLHQKRETVEAALTCFERSVETTKSSCEETGEDSRVVWDLLFMIGKCHEKIANTYKEEAFPRAPFDASDRNCPSRRFEHEMGLALQSYARALADAKEIEKEGGFIAEENGGSAHGSAEVLYRLHASRLKCLIAAVNRHEEDLKAAEKEALRLTERHLFASPEEESTSLSHRDRIWRVLVDIVSALARCRLDNSYFHRSVYRHAQALMWAPVLYDPIGGRAKGSLGTVSAVYASKIRGLNYATNAASSAVSVISSLFGKKRPQLVAAWVTGDGTTSAFQTINNSVRKYDSLRGKYISAYVDSLRHCRLRKELDTFLRWIAGCKRDLPSFFAASAGSDRVRPHGQDSLVIKSRSLESFHFLTAVKRQTNAALANVILLDLKEGAAGDDSTKKHQRYLDDQLKIAYACYLRLNWDPMAQASSRSSLNYQRRHGVKEVVEALTSAYLKVVKDQPSLNIQSDWSGESQLSSLLQASLKKCKEMFPNLSSTYSFSKGRAPSKKNAENEKRKGAPETIQKSFEVAVPEGLGEGETFMTAIQVGNVVKTVRLTVPSAGVSTLRFTLDIPNDTEDNPPKKAKTGSGTSSTKLNMAEHPVGDGENALKRTKLGSEDGEMALKDAGPDSNLAAKKQKVSTDDSISLAAKTALPVDTGNKDIDEEGANHSARKADEGPVITQNATKSPMTEPKDIAPTPAESQQLDESVANETETSVYEPHNPTPTKAPVEKPSLKDSTSSLPDETCVNEPTTTSSEGVNAAELQNRHEK